MQVLRHLQAFCIALFVLHTGADITLTAVTPLNSMLIKGLRVRVGFECGFRVTFVCKIKPYTNRNTVVWQVNSKTYALCLFQNCFNYPPYPAYHGISMSLATETFNLTTDPITLAARRSIYSCNDGVTALSVDAIVKVYMNNETLKMDTSKTNQITLTTGCVYPYGKDDMTFKWFISKDRMILQHSQFVRDRIQSITAFACAETSDCAGAESVQFNSTVTVAVDVFDTGDDYHICATVQHIDEPSRPRAVHCSVKTYKIRSYITDGSTRTCALWKILIGILITSRLPFFQELVLLLIEGDKSNACFMLAGGCLPGSGLIILLLFKKDVDCCCSNRPDVDCCCSNRVLKWISSIVINVIDIAMILVFIDSVLELIQSCISELTHWIIYTSVAAIIYISLSWIVSSIVFACIHGRPKCTQLECDKQSDYMCKLCKTYYCEDCVKQDTCKTAQQMTCESCKQARTEMTTYCNKCKRLLCNSCSIKHIQCNGILLKHPQHGTGREDAIFCEARKHAPRISAHGYCLTCDRYLCTVCLVSSHLKHELLWIQQHLDAVKDELCCLRVHKDLTGSFLGFCLKCKLYICLNCSEKHTCEGDDHHLIMHIPEVSETDSESNRKYCAKHADKRAECYSYTEYAYLCADCFEQGYRPKKRENDFKGEVWINKDICRLHEDFDKHWLNSDAYCLICKICLCRTCYKLHRRFTEHWIKTHKRNRYVCKQCQNEGNIFPVECIELDSFTLSCAECFEEKAITESERSGNNNTLFEAQKRFVSKDEFCQIHEFPFLVKTAKVKSNVYCFICKVYMCKLCFRKHRRLSCVWETNEQLKQIGRSRGFKRTTTELHWKICALIPVFGFVFGVVQLCRRKNPPTDDVR